MIYLEVAVHHILRMHVLHCRQSLAKKSKGLRLAYYSMFVLIGEQCPTFC